jgi:hypothetical protein
MKTTMKNFTIKETDQKLRNGELKPSDFASPNFDRFKDKGVIVHPNIYLPWDRINVTYDGNITKLEDITEEEKRALQLSFDTKGVDRTKAPPAINFIQNEDGTFDFWYGYHRKDRISPDTVGWVFTPIEIPPKWKRRVLCAENEEEYPQVFNTNKILADNLILDIEAGHCQKDEASLDAYLMDAYPNRIPTERKAIKDIVKTHYRGSDTPIIPAKFIILDSDARRNEWNTNHNTEPPMYSLGGHYDEDRQSYIFVSKGEDGSIPRVIGFMGKKIDRGMDLMETKDENGEYIETEIRKTEVIFHVGQAENRKELLKLRITALQVWDTSLKWMKRLGMNISPFHVIGFIAQETEVEKGLILTEEIRKHMK